MKQNGQISVWGEHSKNINKKLKVQVGNREMKCLQKCNLAT